ncbi:uncharacterized protein LOC120335654 [Styela clava]
MTEYTFKPSSNLTDADEWYEIPLSTENEDELSPRDVLQLQKIRNAFAPKPYDDSDFDDKLSSLNIPTHNQHHIVQMNSLSTRTKSATSTSHTTEMAVEFPIVRNITKRRMEQDSGDASCELKAESRVEKNPRTTEGKEEDALKNISSEHKQDNVIQSTNGQQEPIKAETNFEKQSTKYDICHCGVQTFWKRNDCCQLEDALNLKALTITRAHADKMRDQLHSCSSTLKQADDLLISSRALSSALDKVGE